MPHHKSAVKRMRTSEKARQRNRAVKSRLKSVVKKAEEATAPEAGSAFNEAMSALDRAAAKGVIPKRRADRKKSRLAKRLVKAKS
jgi:small subunit ribosomal protein S20